MAGTLNQYAINSTPQEGNSDGTSALNAALFALPSTRCAGTSEAKFGPTIPPESNTLKASSIEIDKFKMSSSETMEYQPLVGFGVVGINTLSILFSGESVTATPVTNAIAHNPRLGYSISTARRKRLLES